jgi:hypothetical protein
LPKNTINHLKNNKDGKILDHLFEFESILDNDESVFYIGDSKYYKHNSLINDNSIYKQFTYAKNVIQFNINIFNANDSIPSLINKNIRYRDDITEGYSISPNFFIQGIIKDYNDFESLGLNPIPNKKIEGNSHFEERLFDRDTLFIKYYNINFLFVLYAYTNFSNLKLNEIRNNFKIKSRNNFEDYFKNYSDFKFYEFLFKDENELKEFVNFEFRNLIGRIFRTNSKPNRLIFAFNKTKEEKLQTDNLLKIFFVKYNPISKQKEFSYISNCPIIPLIKDYEF